MTKIRIAHLSDPHFGTSEPAKIKALLAALSEIRPDLIAISGDITQRARASQFLEARDFFASLAPVPHFAVPGNHDIPLYNLLARLLWPYHGFRKIFGQPLISRKNFGDIDVIGINSTSPKRSVQGDFNRHDIRLLKKYSSDSLVRVAIFHHPMDCRQSSDEKNLLANADESLKHLESAKVDLVLNGHIHDPFVNLSNRRYPNAKRPMILSVAGTCLSSRTRSGAPNSFSVVDIEAANEDAKIKIQRYDLNSAHSADMMFAPITEVTFTRSDRDTWLEG